jgi:hypothetical protein
MIGLFLKNYLTFNIFIMKNFINSIQFNSIQFGLNNYPKWLAMVPLVFLFGSCNIEEKQQVNLQEIATELRTNDCFDENFEQSFCFGSSFQTRTITLNNIPGYPSSCTFTVRYEFKYCEVGTGHLNEIQVLIKNVDILEIDCAKYDQDVDDLLNNPCLNCPTIEDYIFELEEKIQRQVEEDIFGYLTSLGYNLDCGSSAAWTPVTVKSTQYSCHTYCFQTLPKTRGGSWLKPRRIACNNYVCCIIENYMCYDPVTDKIISSVYKYKEGGPEPATCVIPTASYAYCNYYTSNCINACEN